MEFVFVVPRSELFPKSAPHGLALFGSPSEEAAFRSAVRRDGFFVERDYAERTPTLKQVIPYTVVASRRGEVFTLQRSARGTEQRLYGKSSIGVGGHVNPVDAEGGGDLLEAATHRELGEELCLGEVVSVRPLGLLNDDTDAVGAVHVGFVQLATVRGPVTVRETDQLEGGFATLDALRARARGEENFETWSSLLIPCLDAFIHQPVDTVTGSV